MSWARFKKVLGRLGASFGCSWVPLGRLPWKSPPFALGIKVFVDAWLVKVVWMHLEGLLNVLGHFGGHFSSLGAPYGLMLPLLGHLLASFLRSWGVLGRLFGPSWAKLSQDDPRWRKKIRFLRLPCGSWTKLGPENREKSMSKAMFFSSVFLTSIFINF